VLGVLLSLASVVQYRRSIAGLRPAQIPAGYWVNLSVLTSLALGLLGAALAVYLVLT
jgi:putative membrane protein